jgi:hypothetical protein
MNTSMPIFDEGYGPDVSVPEAFDAGLDSVQLGHSQVLPTHPSLPGQRR